MKRTSETYRGVPLSILGLSLLACSIASWALGDDAKPPATPSPVSPEHAEQMAKGLDLFKKSVGPMLLGRCVRCHGGEKTEAELDLTTREKMLKGGAEGPLFEVGKAKESRLYRVVAHLEEPFMPEGGEKLSEVDLAAFLKWLELGAPYDKPLSGVDADPTAWTRRTIDDARREFWSFLPLNQPTVPQLTDDSWSRSDVDRFVMKTARDKGVTPNPPASRRQLLRRAYFDLIGLPPPPEEVDRFLHDPDPDAYGKLIDRLLDSPQYGERWGRHWLDVARFAESHGFEQDYDRPYAYHYRDFVIKALNADMPFNQFLQWQLAGDEIAPEDPLAMMATGFLGAGVFPTQLTEKEFEPARYDELDDMVSTMGTSMLGLSLGCCRCHDHKYDPIPSADYYRLAAALATTIRSEIELDLNPDGYRRAKDQYDSEHAPLVAAVRDYENQELATKFDAWLASPTARESAPAKWQILDLAEFKSLKGATMAKLEDGSILVSGENPKQDQYRFVAETRLRGVTAVRLDALTHPSLTKQGPGRAGNGNFALSDFKISVQPLRDPAAKPVPAKLVAARATHEQDSGHLSVKGSIDDGYESGWAVDGGGIGKDQSAVFEFGSPVDFEGGSRLIIEMRFANNVQHSLGRPRLSLTTAATPVAIDGEMLHQHVVDAVEVLKTQKIEQLSVSQKQALRRRFFEQDAKWRELTQAVAAHEAKQPKPSLTKVMVTSEGFKPIPHHADDRGFPHFYKDVFFLRRGDATQKQGTATPGFLQVLMTTPEREQHWKPQRPENARTSYQRRAMAEWITDPKEGAGHLAARVAVNRLWHHHLGRGIVATPNDFGFQGARPTHPELLDFLAGELVAHGWRLKPLHKLIMTSATYMQDSTFEEADFKVDPENNWCWRFSPRRLEAETIRDSVLAVSGELDRTQFGPGSLDENMKRRSIYFMIKRSKLIPMMQLFDSPEPLVGVGDRPSTTIAPQALMFLNNNQVRSSARQMASRLRGVSPEQPDKVLTAAYAATVARQPTEAETTAAKAFLKRQTDSYIEAQQADPPLLALTDLCQVLLSLNEFIYID